MSLIMGSRPETKLKTATLLSALLIVALVGFSLVSIPTASSNVSSTSSSWATFSPFSSGDRFGQQKDVSVPSADGLWGDFIPEAEIRASQGALRSIGQKATLKENLRDDKKYLTSWPVAGWNNQVICFMNLIYFAVRSRRIPVVPDFTPNPGHLNAKEAPVLRFGQVFDLPRLSALLKTPIVEMSELKHNGKERLEIDKWKYDDEFPEFESRIGQWVDDVEPEHEDIGCWSWTKAARLQEPQPARHYGLHIQNTPLPEAVLANNSDHAISIKPFIDLLKQGHRWTALDEWQTELIANNPEKLRIPEILPDDNFACIDETYYVDTTEMRREAGDDPLLAGVGPWNEVGRHMYFAPPLRVIAHGYLRRAFGLASNENIPSFVAVHMRRGDFGGRFAAVTPLDYSFYVAKVLDQTKKFLGYVPQRVVVMTDETDETWLAQLDQFGWYRFDHVKEQTAEKLGPWYPTLIDAVAMSEGVGFVGLAQSTMSDFAYQRVRTWHGGFGIAMNPGEENKAPEGYVYPYASNLA